MKNSVRLIRETSPIKINLGTLYRSAVIVGVMITVFKFEANSIRIRIG